MKRWIIFILVLIVISIGFYLGYRIAIRLPSRPQPVSPEIAHTYDQLLLTLSQPPTPAEKEKLKKFVAQYTLSPDEIVKVVPEPFLEGRMIYHQYANAPQGTSSATGPSNFLFFLWTEKNELKNNGYFNGGQNGYKIKNVLKTVADVYPWEISGEQEALEKIIRCDIVMRENAAPDQRVEHFVTALQKHFDYPYKMKFRIMPHPVIVMRGKFQLNLLPGKMMIQLSGNPQPPPSYRIIRVAEGDFDKFIKSLEKYLQRYIINEVELPPSQQLAWQEFLGPGYQNDVDSILKNLTIQTGLTFTEETRSVRVLYVEQMESRKS